MTQVRGAALATALVAVAAGLSLRSSREPVGLVSDKSLIGMVNDLVTEPHIPVPVGGKTYYGRCAGYVGRLKSDGGAAFYFETSETAKHHARAAAPEDGS